jgi:hypothetical protein
MIFTLVLIVLVLVSSTIDLYVKREGVSSRGDIERCHNALVRIKTAARMETAGQDPRTTLEDLKATVDNQLPNCEPLLQREDREKK